MKKPDIYIVTVSQGERVLCVDSYSTKLLAVAAKNIYVNKGFKAKIFPSKINQPA